MQEAVDRASLIEATSRSLRQQIVGSVQSGASRNRPQSKGSVHDGTREKGGAWLENPTRALEASTDEVRSGESAQRRIRSAENQHRTVSASAVRGEPSHFSQSPALSTAAQTLSTTALDTAPPVVEDEDPEEDAQVAAVTAATSAVGRFPEDFHQDLKRPLSRKKDPSSAAGLGSFAGPARMTDAFEQRKTRQPIPVESWGPRPPSRAGLPQKSEPLVGTLDTEPKAVLSSGPSRSSSAAGNRRPANEGRAASKPCEAAAAPVATWAAARATDLRAMTENRIQRGRDRKPSMTAGRAAGEVFGPPAELGIFGCGTRTPAQPLSKSLSGVFDTHNSAAGARPIASQFWQGSPSPSNPWPAHVDEPQQLEVSGCGLSEAAGWHSGSSSAGPVGPARGDSRRGVWQAVSLEDVETEESQLHGGRREPPAPQVIVTRSTLAGKSRADTRRNTDQLRGLQREMNMPFPTSLDVDFLSLFAS